MANELMSSRAKALRTEASFGAGVARTIQAPFAVEATEQICFFIKESVQAKTAAPEGGSCCRIESTLNVSNKSPLGTPPLEITDSFDR